jgi:Bacterial self-protective colicin-like immunity
MRLFEILDRRFADVDSYVADSELREQGDLDDDGLHERAAAAQRDLQRYSS